MLQTWKCRACEYTMQTVYGHMRMLSTRGHSMRTYCARYCAAHEVTVENATFDAWLRWPHQ